VCLLAAACGAMSGSRTPHVPREKGGPILGPEGNRFYDAPSRLPNGPHGTLIWERPFRGVASLAGAANTLLLYKQVGISGRLVATSGFVAVPRGTAPMGGWPVIDWAHGTTGIADQCAPTRNGDSPEVLNNQSLLEHWIKDGYAIVETDYEGLGTPGSHPYLIGSSEARAVLDAVLAARQFDPALSNRVVIAGHSQGGHAALWASSMVKQYAPELNVAAVIAFAPASHLASGVEYAQSSVDSGKSATVALALRGIEIAYPAQQVTRLLSPAAARLWPNTLDECISQLQSPSSFGLLPLGRLLNPTANIKQVLAALSLNDPGQLKISIPILLEQGLADTTVRPAFTEALSKSLSSVGDEITLHTYPNATHATVANAASADATQFLRQDLPE
jgi:pimeloyl-ACP methyl ester carboxylesterase